MLPDWASLDQVGPEKNALGGWTKLGLFFASLFIHEYIWTCVQGHYHHKITCSADINTFFTQRLLVKFYQSGPGQGDPSINFPSQGFSGGRWLEGSTSSTVDLICQNIKWLNQNRNLLLDNTTPIQLHVRIDRTGKEHLKFLNCPAWTLVYSSQLLEEIWLN